MDGEPVHQPVQERCRPFDVEVRSGEPGPVKVGDHVAAGVPDRCVGHIQDLLDALITGGLGYERNVDLHLGPPFGVEGQKFLDDGED